MVCSGAKEVNKEMCPSMRQKQYTVPPPSGMRSPKKKNNKQDWQQTWRDEIDYS